MIRFRSLIAFVALVPLVSAEGKEDKKDDKKNEKKDEKKPVAFASKAGKFSVALPEKPTEKTNKVKVGDMEVDHFIFTVKQTDRAQIITYIDYPKMIIGGDKEKFIAGVVERNLESLKGGKVAANVPITIGKDKHPGRDVRVELPDQKRLYRVRAFLVGERVYQVVVLGPDEFVKSKEVDDYLNSFKVEE
jgi:hypothetical protein